MKGENEGEEEEERRMKSKRETEKAWNIRVVAGR